MREKEWGVAGVHRTPARAFVGDGGGEGGVDEEDGQSGRDAQGVDKCEAGHVDAVECEKFRVIKIQAELIFRVIFKIISNKMINNQ